ncbi:MAG: hypothetical protein MAG431_02101 [Chloroflexi bacterium]|nr:hypothetical protein [Chloroflexota bacterium]
MPSGYTLQKRGCNASAHLLPAYPVFPCSLLTLFSPAPCSLFPVSLFPVFLFPCFPVPCLPCLPCFPSHMKDSSQQLLDKAARAIEATEALLENGIIEFAIGRAYYVMLYITKALLNENDVHFIRFDEIHNSFEKAYVDTGIFEVKYHYWLVDAFRQRIIGDYYTEVTATEGEVQKILEQSQEFLKAAQRYLENKEQDTGEG